MSEVAIANYDFEAVHEANRQLFLPRIPELLETYPAFACFGDKLRSLKDVGELDVSPAYPLPALDLLTDAYADIKLVRRLLEDGGVELIRDEIMPYTGVDTKSSKLTGNLTGYYGFTLCRMAEIYFKQAENRVYSKTGSEQNRISVFHDDNSEPLIFRKTYESATGLTLVDMELSGIPVPAGSIVGINGRLSGLAEQTGRTEQNNAKFGTYQMPEIFQLAVGRLSAWAYSSAEDKLPFCISSGDSSGFKQEALDAIIPTSLDDFRTASRKVMELCGVEPAKAQAA